MCLKITQKNNINYLKQIRIKKKRKKSQNFSVDGKQNNISKRISHFLEEDCTKFAATIFFKDQQKTFGITIDRKGLGEFTVVLKLSRLYKRKNTFHKSIV